MKRVDDHDDDNYVDYDIDYYDYGADIEDDADEDKLWFNFNNGDDNDHDFNDGEASDDIF